MTFKIVQGSSRTVITASITNLQARGPEDLSQASVALNVRPTVSSETTLTVAGNLLPGWINGDGDLDLSRYPIPGSGGRVEFPFPVGSLNVAAGPYEAEIAITYQGGGTEIVYDLIKILVRE